MMDYFSMQTDSRNTQATQTSQWPVPSDSVRYVVPEPSIHMLASLPLTRGLYRLACVHYRRAVGPHMHRAHHRDWLLIYCTECKAFLYVDREPYTVGSGDLLLLPAGARHRYSADPDHPWTIHWLHYTGPLAA